MTIANIYAPNQDNPDFFRDKTLEIEAIGNDIKVIAGDLNLVFDLSLDKVGGRQQTNHQSAEFLKQYMDLENVIDIWREVNQDKKELTWKRLHPSPIFVR